MSSEISKSLFVCSIISSINRLILCRCSPVNLSISGWIFEFEYAFKMGVATGSASAFSMNLATAEEVANLLKEIN